MLGAQPPASEKGCFHSQDGHITCHRTSALTCTHMHTCRCMLAHWHVLLASHAHSCLHVVPLASCQCFQVRCWQGTVKGQSFNEPLWDLPQLLTISLQLIRQGIAALAISLHHFLPLLFPPEPPACSHTNQPIIDEDTNWVLFPGKLLQPHTYPKFYRNTSTSISLCLFSLHSCLVHAELHIHN